ncbi:MAG: LysM peptidoglycan-binding domain-containing protein [Lentisphaeria bacterium]|nr:LysM peptidoglycan-binding domain-containing protein [Lentisphaeria bacterium]
MKLIHLSAVAVAVSLFPAVLCSCISDGSNDPVEVKPEAESSQNTDIYFAPQDTKKIEVASTPAPEVKPEEPAPAPVSEVKPQEPAPAPAPEVKPQEPAPAPKEEAPKKAELPCNHTVRTGDNLWKLAREYYGSGAKWTIIFEANRDKLTKAEFLAPGTVLTIPAEK